MKEQFNFRIDSIQKKKLRQIAEEETRSIGNEIERAIKKHIAEYEAEHGEIKT